MDQIHTGMTHRAPTAGSPWARGLRGPNHSKSMDTVGPGPQPLNPWTRGSGATTPGTTWIWGGCEVLGPQPQEGRSDFSKKCIAKDGTDIENLRENLMRGKYVKCRCQK